MSQISNPKIAVIGVRGYGKTYFETLRQLPDVQVVAVCDLDIAAATALAQTYGIARVDDDYQNCIAESGADAVIIATPHFLHFPMVRTALIAGKHVFCEKPLALGHDEATELARLSRELGQVLSCHYNQRLSARGRFLRHWSQSMALGEIYHAEARWLARWTEFMVDPITSWRTDPKKSGGGILIGRGSHLLDLLLYLLNWPQIETVSAQTQCRLSHPGIDDFASVQLRLAGGHTLSLNCSYLAHLPAFSDEIAITLFGTEGGACVESRSSNAEVRQAGKCDMSDGTWQSFPEQERDESGPKSVLEDFVCAIREGREPLVTAEQAALVARLVETAYQSAREGRELQFE